MLHGSRRQSKLKGGEFTDSFFWRIIATFLGVLLFEAVRFGLKKTVDLFRKFDQTEKHHRLASSLAGDQTFPSVDGKELFERIKSEMENEVERRDEPNRYS